MGRVTIPEMIVKGAQDACRATPGRPLYLGQAAPDTWVLSQPGDGQQAGVTPIAEVTLVGGNYQWVRR